MHRGAPCHSEAFAGCHSDAELSEEEESLSFRALEGEGSFPARESSSSR